MNFGPRKIVISIAAIPAIRTSPRSIAAEATSLRTAAAVGRHPLRRRRRATRASVRRSSPTERDPLTSTASPGSSRRSTSGTAASASGAQRVRRVLARQLADADQRLDPEAAGQRPDLAVVAGGVRAQLLHLAEHGHPPASGGRAGHARRPGARAPRASRSGWRCSSRSRRRFRRRARPTPRAGARTLSPAPDAPSPAGRIRGRCRSAIAQSAFVRLWASAKGRSKRRLAGRGRDPGADSPRRRPRTSWALTSPPGPKVIVSRLSCRWGSSASASTGTTAVPPARRPAEDLGLRLGDRLQRPQQLQVHGPDVRDRGHVGLGDLAQLGDLAEAAHRHLQHQHLGLRRAPTGSSAAGRSRCCSSRGWRGRAAAGGRGRCP